MARAEDALPWRLGAGGAAQPGPADGWAEFGRAYEQCYSLVWRYTLSRVHDPVAAEDLVADIFERALHGWPTFQHRAPARAWILGIARHVIADYRRQGGRQTVSVHQVPEIEPRLLSPSAEESAGRNDEFDTLRRLIGRLDETEQDLLALRYVAELPFREIGVVLGVQEVTARVRLHRVLARLRSWLEEGKE